MGSANETLAEDLQNVLPAGPDDIPFRRRGRGVRGGRMILLSTTSQPPPEGFFVLRLDPSSALLVNPEQPLRGRSSGRGSRSIPRTAFSESSIDDIPSHQSTVNQPRSEAEII